jgi:hypothetical protein
LYHYHPLLLKEKLSVFRYSINHSTLDDMPTGDVVSVH